MCQTAQGQLNRGWVEFRKRNFGTSPTAKENGIKGALDAAKEANTCTIRPIVNGDELVLRLRTAL